MRCDLCDATKSVDWVWTSSLPEMPKWAVCNHCHEYILADKAGALRAWAKMGISDPEAAFMDPITLTQRVDERNVMIAQTHKMFWDNKTGYHPIANERQHDAD